MLPEHLSVMSLITLLMVTFFMSVSITLTSPDFTRHYLFYRLDFNLQKFIEECAQNTFCLTLLIISLFFHCALINNLLEFYMQTSWKYNPLIPKSIIFLAVSIPIMIRGFFFSLILNSISV